MTVKYKYNGKGYQPYENQNLNLSKEFLIQLYRGMLRIRRIEEAIESRYHEDEMKTPIHLSIGHEAVSIGSCFALKKDDLIYCSHRTHGHYLAKGGSLKEMLAELHCRTSGCSGSRGGSMHLLDKSAGMAGSSAIVAGAIPIATGAALSFQLKRENQIVTVYLGDAATEEGACWEAINFAALKKLPIIFFCENNFFSVCSPLEVRQPTGVEIYKKAGGFGIPSIQIDGINVLETYKAMQTAVSRARNSEGPTFIEALTYRWRGHVGAGDDSSSGYRDPDEVHHWQGYCPINGFYDYLAKMNFYTEVERVLAEKEINDEIEMAFEFAISSPNPEEKDLHTHVYSQ